MANKRNTCELAVALSYEPTHMRAPQVSARGEEEVARELKKLARRYGIPILTDKNLIKPLGTLATAEEIPPELYEDVAGILRNLPGFKPPR